MNRLTWMSSNSFVHKAFVFPHRTVRCSKTWASTQSFSPAFFFSPIIFCNIFICWNRVRWLKELNIWGKAASIVVGGNLLAQSSGLRTRCAELNQQGSKHWNPRQIIYLSNYYNYATYTSWKLLVLVTLNYASFCSTRFHLPEAILTCPWCRHAHKFVWGLDVAW